MIEYILLPLIIISSISAVIVRHKNILSLYKILKPLPVFLLILFLFFSTDMNSFYANVLLVGLIFSLIGDIFLLNEKHFKMGLISFLLTHIFYSYAFILGIKSFNPYLILPILVYGILFFIKLIKDIQKFYYPVLLYIIIICIMVWLAANRFYILENISGLLSFLGALLFMISDSFLGWNKFKNKIKFGQVKILSTYYMGQVLITLSS